PEPARETKVIRGPVLLLQPGDVAVIHVPVRPRDREAVAEADRAAQRRRRETAEPDRRMRFLDRPRRHPDVLEIEELALESNGLAGKSATDDVEGLVGALSPFLRRHAEACKLFLFETDANPELEATARNDVDGRDILGQSDRIVKRHQQYARGDADTLGSRGDCGGGGQDRRKIAVVDEVMLLRYTIVIISVPC